MKGRKSNLKQIKEIVKQENNKLVNINPNLTINIFNINGLNSPRKRQKLPNHIKKELYATI